MKHVVTASRDLSEVVVVSPGFVAVRRNGFWRTDLPVFADDDSLPLVRDADLAEKLVREARAALLAAS
jgi:hypothetical protein